MCGCGLGLSAGIDDDDDADHIPSRDEVMMLSSWNPSQQMGSSPTTLDYSLLVCRVCPHQSVPTIIGGNRAVRALGSTG